MTAAAMLRKSISNGVARTATVGPVAAEAIGRVVGACGKVEAMNIPIGERTPKHPLIAPRISRTTPATTRLVRRSLNGSRAASTGVAYGMGLDLAEPMITVRWRDSGTEYDATAER